MNEDWRTRGQAHARDLEEQPPYWQDGLNVAHYPFAGTNGITIGVFAILSALGLVPAIGALAGLFLLLAVPKHALEVLRDSAHGHRLPPRFGFDIGDRAVFAFLVLEPADWPPLIAAAERAGLPRLAEAARTAQAAAQSPPSP